MNTVLILSVTALLILTTGSYESPVVRTELGTITGFHKQSYNGRIFSSFEGIPFAKPPVGENRFKPPQEFEPWRGVWNASHPHSCIQFFRGVSGQEDCLYLNVYVPREDPLPGENLNVFAMIHGGGFMYGDGHKSYAPEYLMDRDLVYVSFNYRLGILGFLDTEDGTITPNNGMRDQVMALKWIKKHIKQFGGNPDSVTLAGLSAGGASTHQHYLSPLSKGLFHRGIAFSGSALNPWTLQEAAAEKAKYLADLVGCSAKSTQEMVECLRSRPAAQIVNTVKYFCPINEIIPFSPFAPTVEKNAEGAFLPDHPQVLLENKRVNDVPFIFTVTTEEGIFPAIFVEEDLDKMEDDWLNSLPLLLDYNYTVSDADKVKLAKQFKDIFFDGKKLSAETMSNFIKLLGDRHFVHGIEKSARLQAKISDHPVYLYVYGYRSKKIRHSLYTKSTVNYGAGHGSDMTFLFLQRPLGPLTPEEVKLKEFLLDIVENFSSKRKPHLEEWTPVENTKTLKYLKIKSPNDIKVESAEELTETNLWDNLYAMEYKINKRRIIDEL